LQQNSDDVTELQDQLEHEILPEASVAAPEQKSFWRTYKPLPLVIG
jgi:hypothetical protein